ncbi:hypothetical protein EMN47_18175 [Prolixibacteraceae bacterium JC049]|jgi:hypothetical protein|nr:hypothetical protein [Prolixibacteraceae bacterium JC049]
MMNNKEFEVFGTLDKEETLFVLNDKILPKTLVFEGIEPFPGYYHEIPDESMPVYVYLILAENYTWEDVMRATQLIKAETQLNFEAAKCYIKTKQQTYSAVRLRHLKSYDEVAVIQEGFVKNEMALMESKIRTEKTSAIIKLIKFFLLEEIDKGVYIDKGEAFHGYFEIPGKLKWKAFEQVTTNVRYNWEGSQFDAAIGTIYKDSELKDVVRIYSPKIDEAYLAGLKGKYLERIK